MLNSKKEYHISTQAIHGGVVPDKGTGASQPPVIQSASYVHETAQGVSDVFFGRKFGYQYTRVMNPSVVALENRIAALDQARGVVAVASGMAAVSTALMALTSAGDEIVASKSLFGGTYYLFHHVLENYGVTIHQVDMTDLEAVQSKLNDKTRLIFFEVIGNPKLDVPNISAISKMAKPYNIPVIADTTIMTPYLFDARKFGVDVMVLSTTKYMCGHGTTVGGAIIDLGTFDWAQTKSTRVKDAAQKLGEMSFLGRCRRQIASNIGCALAPMNAFLTTIGIETLPLRMEKHCENALALAQWFECHSKIDKVNYPALKSSPFYSLVQSQFNGRASGIITLRVGSKERAYQVIDHLKLVKNMVNIGDSKTLAIHPLSTIYREFDESQGVSAGVFSDLIRVSVGLENIEDLKQDFDYALQKLS